MVPLYPKTITLSGNKIIHSTEVGDYIDNDECFNKSTIFSDLTNAIVCLEKTSEKLDSTVDGTSIPKF